LAAPTESPAPQPASAAEESPRGGLIKDRSLPLRILSAIVFIPILAYILVKGGMLFLILVTLLIALGLWEFFSMMSVQGLRPYRWIGLTTGVAVAWFVYSGLPTHANLFLSAFVIGTMALELLRPRDHGIEPVSVTIFGVLYVGWLSAHLLYLRELPHTIGVPYPEGVAFVLLAVVPTWACDTSAYAIGQAIGRHRLHPAVSPKKSVEGSVAGLVAAVGGALLAHFWFLPVLELWQALVLGVLIGVFGQVGDLVESLLKRTSQAKDSATWIPGHGGVLDRFDSLFFTAPLTYYFLVLIVFGGSRP
jgi:phosphatidate cytidylyltransferase